MATTFRQVSNNAKGTVASGDLNNTTNPVTFDIGTGEGAAFPATTGGAFFVTVWDSSSYPDPTDDSNMEIMLVTSRSTDALTATRAQQSTSNVAHAGTPTCALLLTAQNITTLNQATLGLEYAMQPGVIVMFGGSSQPTEEEPDAPGQKVWLLCNGQAVSRTTYANLFSAIGTTFGPGNGTSTFDMPNFQGRMAIGVSGTYALGVTGGAATANLQHAHTTSAASAEVGNHRHSVDPPSTTSGGISASHTHNTYATWTFYSSTGGVNYVTGAPGDARGNPTTTQSSNHTHNVNINPFYSDYYNNGSSHSHGNTGNALSSSQSILNPYLPVNYLIKT